MDPYEFDNELGHCRQRRAGGRKKGTRKRNIRIRDISDGNKDAVSSAATASKCPEQIRILVGVRDKIFSGRGHYVELNSIVYACEWMETRLIS